MSTLRNRMRPIHPGEILRDEYLVPRELSANALASALGVPTNRVTAILNGERGVTADTALRLARYLGTTPNFWMNLQTSYDLRLAEDPYCPGGGKRDPSLKRRTVRCPVCRRRLLLAEVHCIGGELTCYKIPEHKPKVKTSRRQVTRAGRLGARGK